MYWNYFCEKQIKSEGYRRKDKRVSSGITSKVKFVREQRIFAKGQKSPLKKRGTGVLRSLRMYLSSSAIQNTPPVSTLLNLFGVNVVKFCEEYNKHIKKEFFEGIPLIVEVLILKDLSFKIRIEGLRFTNFLPSLDVRDIIQKKGRSMLILNTESINELISLEEPQGERCYTDLDLWVLYYYFNVYNLKLTYEMSFLSLHTYKGWLKSYNKQYFLNIQQINVK